MLNDFTVDLGSHNQIQVHRTHAEEEWNVTLADTGLETLTAERIHRVRCYVGDEPFMATYCDGVTNLNVEELLRFHRMQGRLATLTGVRDVSRFGIVQEDDNGKVEGFKEKPQIQERINAGFFVFEPGVFDYLEGQQCMLEQGPLSALAEAEQLSIFSHDGFWQCMDTKRDHDILEKLWTTSAPWTK